MTTGSARTSVRSVELPRNDREGRCHGISRHSHDGIGDYRSAWKTVNGIFPFPKTRSQPRITRITRMKRSRLPLFIRVIRVIRGSTLQLRLDRNVPWTYTPSLTSTHLGSMALDRRPGGTVRLVVRDVFFPARLLNGRWMTNRGFLLRRSVLQGRYWMTFGHGTGRQGVGRKRSVTALRCPGQGNIRWRSRETGGSRSIAWDSPRTLVRGPVRQDGIGSATSPS